jgi:uncharacterized protein YkwD
MYLSQIIVALMLAITACTPAAKPPIPGKLGATTKVSGELKIALSQPETDNIDVYAVAFAAVETSSVVFCRKVKSDSCAGSKLFNMTFQKRSETGFYFISAEPLDFPEGTEILFLSYVSSNGTKVSQKGSVLFRPGTVESEDELDNPESEDDTDTTEISQTDPDQGNSGGLNASTLIDLFKNLLGGNTTPSTNQDPITPTTPTTPTTPITPTTPTTPISGTGQTDAELVPNPDNVQISASEFEVIKLTNAERIRQGKTALIVQQKIMVTSRESSRLMQQRNSLVHGLTTGWSGENIAMGYSSPSQVVQGWITSPGHYANMMGSFKYIGVGDTSAAGGSPYWTQQFNQ